MCQCVLKNAPLLIFLNNSVKKLADFNNFWCMESWGNLWLVGYKFAHLTRKVLLHYLVKFGTIIVTSLLQKY